MSKNDKLFNDMFMDLMTNPDKLNTLFGGLYTPPESKPNYSIGVGIELIPFDKDYGYLYKDGKQLSETIFRKGGMGGEFKDGYNLLLKYEKGEIKKDKNGKDYQTYTSGYWVIVNTMGEIVMEDNESFSHNLYHQGGIIASKKDFYYNLLTGEKIMVKSSSVIDGKKFIIVEHRYDWYGKNEGFKTGVYQINKQTGEVIKLDETK